MTDIKTPQAKDWNHYWSLDKTEKFTKISWSKKRILSILQPIVLKSSSALDAGCGSGFFAAYFSEQGLETTALDYSQSALEIARKQTNGKAEILKEDLLDPKMFQRISKRYDIIFTDGLLEHFPRSDQDVILTNLRHLLTEKGKMITFVPNRWSPWELIRPFYMPGIEEDPFIMKDLKQLHEENGLTILNFGGLNTFPFRFSPDQMIGSLFGMLLYVVVQKKVT